MAVFGIREKGADLDVTTIQVKNNSKMEYNAEKVMEELLKNNSVFLDAEKEYEVHLLWIEN